MDLNSKLASFNVLDYWSQELLEDGGLGFPKPVVASQARAEISNNNTMKDSDSIGNDNNQQRKHWPPLRCPRCDSGNTKFCYYNNYNRSQPRHFCKACRRHWTEGGTLRNIPVGGGRKNKRPNKAAAAATATAVTTAAIEPANSTGAIRNIKHTSPAVPWPQPEHQKQQKFPNFGLIGDESSNIFPDQSLRQLLLSSTPQTRPKLQLSSTNNYSISSNLESTPMIRTVDHNSSQIKPGIMNSFENIFSSPSCISLSSYFPYVSNHQKEGVAVVGASPTASGARGASATAPAGVVLYSSAPSNWSRWDDDVAAVCDSHHHA